MTAKRLNYQHLDDEQGNKPEAEERSGNDGNSSGDDDDSHSSSESSTADSYSKESPPPESTMNPDQIRQNARELLLTSPDGSSKKKRDTVASSSNSISNNTADKKANGYRSYHDGPDVRTSSTSQFTNSNATSTLPWPSHNENDEGLSMTDVASMTFTCVTHCLTEGYRAASSYYNGYQEDQFLSVSTGQNSSHNNYQQAGSYHDAAYNNNSTPHNISDDDHRTKLDVNYKNGYSDGYQTKFSDHSSQPKEVMDRGVPSRSNSNDYPSQMLSGQDTEQTKEEWASVQVPSSYQGGRVGGWELIRMLV